MGLRVLTASAGSGKTASLVVAYLKLVIAKPQEFAHILALTFTNKAAGEMKDRILDYLDGLLEFQRTGVRSMPSFIIEQLREATGLEEEEICRRASMVRQLILHQYHHFHISTIDSFEHGIVRAFAHDLRLPFHFEVEMDADSLLDRAVPELLQKVGRDKDLTGALLEFSLEKALSEKGWNVGKDLKAVALKLFREDSQHFIGLLSRVHPDSLVRGKDKILGECSAIEAKIKTLAESAFGLFGPWGADCFINKSKGFYSFVEGLAAGDKERILKVSKSFENVLESGSVFASSARSALPEDLIGLETSILRSLQELGEYLDSVRPRYALLAGMRAKVYQVILLREIQNQLDLLRDEKQIIHISEFNRRIADVIRKQPEPFIYERTGNRFRSIFLDEFQDTSVLQWFNLIPLMENSLAVGGEGLIVGDPKQAIYRFRSGEVELFTSLPDFPKLRDFPSLKHSSPIMTSLCRREVLDVNYRSLKGIVEFNNEFFEHCLAAMPDIARKAYAKLAQRADRNGEQGQVGLLILEENGIDDYRVMVKNELLLLIEELHQEGFSSGDIAVLCRENKEAADIASFLIERGISVTSPESLRLTNSPIVRFLQSLLRLLHNNHDQIAAAGILKFLSETGRLKHLMLSEALRLLRESPHQRLRQILKDSMIPLDLDNILNLGIYEACESCLTAVGIDDTSDSFLNTFLDYVLERTVERNDSLDELVEWLGQNPNLSLSLPAGSSSMQIMTVHKSKGLQFPVVIYPSYPKNRRLTRNDAWIDETGSDLPVALVGLAAESPNPAMDELYRIEAERSQLDEMNAHYVAFTRAKDCLYIMAPIRKSGDGSSLGPLIRSFAAGKNLQIESGSWLRLYRPHQHGNAVKESRYAISRTSVSRTSWRERLSLVTEGGSREQQWGRTVHQFLSRIKHTDQIDGEVKRTLVSNHLREEQGDILRSIALKVLDHPDLSWLYSGDVLSRPEMSISLGPDNILRPDRVAFRESEAMIAEFKTGVRSDDHVRQIEKYAEALAASGFRVSKKVLVYLTPDVEVISIN